MRLSFISFLGLAGFATATIPLVIFSASEIIPKGESDFPLSTDNIIGELENIHCFKIAVFVTDALFSLPSLRSEKSVIKSFISASEKVVLVPFAEQENALSLIENYVVEKCKSVRDSVPNILEASDSNSNSILVLDREWSKHLPLIISKFGKKNVIVFYSAPPPSIHLEKRASLITNFTALPFNKRPLFQRFFFFNPAIFSGLVTMFILLIILVYGINALASIKSPSRFEVKKRE